MKYFLMAMIFIAGLFVVSFTKEEAKAATLPTTIQLELPMLHQPQRLGASYTDADVHWLALNMYHEARGESDEGKIAVSNVVLNRVESGDYPRSIQGVVTQKVHGKCAFPWYCKRDITAYETEMYRHCFMLAKQILDNHQPTLYNNDVLFYQSKHSRAPWTKNVELVAVVGNHKFYRIK